MWVCGCVSHSEAFCSRRAWHTASSLSSLASRRRDITACSLSLSAASSSSNMAEDGLKHEEWAAHYSFCDCSESSIPVDQALPPPTRCLLLLPVDLSQFRASWLSTCSSSSTFCLCSSVSLRTSWSWSWNAHRQVTAHQACTDACTHTCPHARRCGSPFGWWPLQCPAPSKASGLSCQCGHQAEPQWLWLAD